MTFSHEQLTFLHALLDGQEEDKWVQAANLILAASGLTESIADFPSADKIIRTCFQQLLDDEDYLSAATLIWGESMFDTRPKYVPDIFRTIKDNALVLLQGASSTSKCLGLGTKVLMFDGSTKSIEDVRPGERLMGDDSTPREVLSAGRGIGPLYRIIPERGEPWICNDAHILSLRWGTTKKCGSGYNSTTRVKGGVVDIGIENYLGLSHDKRSSLKQFSVGVRFNEQPLPFDPYIYGAWIGDGGTDVPALHTPDGPMAKRWCEYFSGIGYRISSAYHDKCPMWCARYSPPQGGGGKRNPFTQFIRTSVNEGEKFIRRDYLVNTRDNRLKLLAGLIDSDGWVENGTGYQFVSKFEGLARQVQWLARSLGFASHLHPRVHEIKSIGFRETYWHASVAGQGITQVPTLEKHASEPIGPKVLTNTGFRIESIGIGEWAGVVIGGNHRFLLGDFTVTHNTYSAGAWFYLDWRRDPAFTSIKVAALSDDHLRKNIFSHIHTLHKSAAIPYEDPADIKDIDLYFGLRSAGNQFGFSGIAFKQSSEATGHFKGYKPMPYRKFPHPKFGYSSRVRILGDEGQNWPEGPFKDFSSPISSISGVEHVKIVISYNPESVAQRVVQLAEPETGWQMEDCETMYEWLSKEGWRVLRLDAKLCENVAQRKVVYPNFQTYEGYLKLLRGEGDTSNRFWTFARGWPPLRSQNWTVVPPSWPATQRGEAIYDEVICNCVSVDCAYQGLDKVLMTVGRFGIASGWTKANGETVKFLDPSNPKLYKSRPILQMDQQLTLLKSSSPTKLAEEIRGKCQIMHIEPEWVVVDGTAQGAGTASFLKEYWGDILIINWGKGATDMKILAEDTSMAKDKYDGIISEMHFAFKEWLNPDICAILIHPQISPNPLNTQMSTRRFCYVKGGKMKVESKPEFKSRNQRSPDEHDCFLAGTKVLTVNGEVPIEKLSRGDMIVTPFGNSPVVDLHSEVLNKITSVKFSNGNSLSGKGKHKIFTWNRGWQSLDSLVLTDQVEDDRMLPLWNILSLLFTRDGRSSFKHLVDTIRTETKHRRRDYFIESSGLSITALFPKVCVSIIKMAIGRTIVSRIWNWCNQGNTPSCTGRCGSMIHNLSSKENAPLPQLKKLPPSGILQKREWLGTSNTPKSAAPASPRLSCRVSSAERNSSQEITTPNSVVKPAGINATGGMLGLIKSAWSAVRCLVVSSTTRKSVAPVSAGHYMDTKGARVFNIQLKDHNVYYANGVLVQNCAIQLCHLIRSRAKVLPGMATQLDTRRPVDDGRETVNAKALPKYDDLQLLDDDSAMTGKDLQ